MKRPYDDTKNDGHKDCRKSQLTSEIVRENQDHGSEQHGQEEFAASDGAAGGFLNVRVHRASAVPTWLAGFGDRPAAIWAFEDSHVHNLPQVGRGKIQPMKKPDIMFTTDPELLGRGGSGGLLLESRGTAVSGMWQARHS
jgi:hypothetical protein